MPPLHDGQLPEAAETEAQCQINLPGRCWQGREAAAVSNEQLRNGTRLIGDEICAITSRLPDVRK